MNTVPEVMVPAKRKRPRSAESQRRKEEFKALKRQRLEDDASMIDTTEREPTNTEILVAKVKKEIAALPNIEEIRKSFAKPKRTRQTQEPKGLQEEVVEFETKSAAVPTEEASQKPVAAPPKRSLRIQESKKRKKVEAKPKNEVAALPKRSVAVDALPWNEVTMPDMFDDAEGFFGLEEVEGVEVVKEGGTYKFVSVALGLKSFSDKR